MKPISFTIQSAPRTKKTSSRIFKGKGGRPIIMPSAAFCEFQEKALLDLAEQKRGMRVDFPLLVEVNCCALFYRDANRGDAVGYYQALADVLQKAEKGSSGVVADDVQIRSWDGSRLLKDKDNPRVELVLAPLGEEGTP